MKSLCLTLLLSAFVCTCVRAQLIDVNNNRVVAAGGINLRNAPGLGGKRQSLSLPQLFQTPHPVAVGDIEGDGRPDVITFHDGEVSHHVLHLSREAPSGKLVSPVAEELFGDCC